MKHDNFLVENRIISLIFPDCSKNLFSPDIPRSNIKFPDFPEVNSALMLSDIMNEISCHDCCQLLSSVPDE